MLPACENADTPRTGTEGGSDSWRVEQAPWIGLRAVQTQVCPRVDD